MDPLAFQALIGRVRVGDREAAATLVRTCERPLRREIRMRLTDPRLRKVVDTSDICQSVLGAFFLHVLEGEFDLSSPAQLVRLLATMARNRILNYARSEMADRRDVRRRLADGEQALLGVADREPSPSRSVADAEIIERALELLSDDEREILRSRGEGASWADLADVRGETAEGLRKRTTRAIRRVSSRLGLEDEDHA